MFGIEEILQDIVSKWISIFIIGTMIGIAVMYLVSKLTGSVKTGSFIAGGILFLCFYWLAREGYLINFLADIK